MAFKRTGYYYDHQLKNYILQFMAIFSGIQVQIGKWNEVDEKLISVPIHYGAPDRVVASILAENTQNKPLRLPALSAYFKGVDLAPERMAGTGTERRQSYVPIGGLIPDDIKVIHQRKPTPYNLQLELGIYCSNTNQHFQILEQFLPLFDPQITLQVSDAIFDWTRLTTVTLKNINIDSAYPIGIDKRIIQSTLVFEMPIFIDTPADVRADFVNKILIRVGAINASSDTNLEIISDLDEQNIPYTIVADGTATNI